MYSELVSIELLSNLLGVHEAHNKQESLILERVSTRVVVVVVVVVAQPHMYAYACAHASGVMEPKSHRSLPKHLPLHTEWRVIWEASSSDKLYKLVFSGITGQVVVMLIKLTTKMHSAAAGYFSQLHRYGPLF